MESNGHNEAVIRELIISNQSGMHARPAATFVKMANKFKAEITVTKDGDSVNGKSIMGLMTLAAAKGTRLVIETSGDDAEDAADAIQSLIEGKFGEA
ncbi:MAG TPA: HPr family phosphocarrier protein [Verrucomicrobiales bacterium]|nr:HPr family phosphocarrier protein [Verrucomicrobiales bacterium]